jgi:type IV pilus assembly protein PilC
MTQFYRQFATLMESAVPLALSLEILEGLTADRPLRRAIANVSREVQQGSTLTDALRRHPKVFSEIAVNLINAGEEGGTLDNALERLAGYVERDSEVREKVRGAMIYPAFILLVAAASVATLLTLVVPTFESLFSASGAALPYSTQVLVDTSDFIGANWTFLIVGGLFGILLLRALYGTDAVRYVTHRVVLRVPVAGRIVRKVAVARLSRTLSSMLGSGVSILDALTASAATSGNQVIERAIQDSRDSVAQGMEISEALARHAVLPKLVSGMVGVGEQTGKLDHMFEKVADFFEREAEAEIDGILKTLEPALVVLVGITLGGIVMAMYLPIFDAIGAIDPVGM